jgi:hypothetical protein
MQAVRIIFLCILAAITYGIIHDQVTARICVEYFTVGHPPVFPTDDPTLLGIGWGIIATWWVGLFLGIPLAVVARAGPRPKRLAASLVKPIACLLVVMAVCAALAGSIGWVLAQNGVMELDGRLANALPADRQTPFLIDAWAHAASYLVGLVGGIVVIIVVWRSRGVALKAG